MTRAGENRLVDDLNAYGCTRETLRKRIMRAASTDLTAVDLAEMFGCNVRTAERYLAQARKKAG